MNTTCILAITQVPGKAGDADNHKSVMEFIPLNKLTLNFLKIYVIYVASCQKIKQFCYVAKKSIRIYFCTYIRMYVATKIPLLLCKVKIFTCIWLINTYCHIIF